MDDFRVKAIEAVQEIAAIVKRTLGPGGNAILIERVGQALDGSPIGPKITKDGVSVADECFSTDPQKNVIMQAVKGICKKTVNVAGDGTTTAIVLGEAILLETFKLLKQNPELNPQIVKEELDVATKEVLKLISKKASKINDFKKIKEVATISANGDEEIGTVIAEAFSKVGAEGVVTVDEGHTAGITLDVVDGYQFQRGAEARDNFFNSQNLTHFEAQDAAVLIFDGKLLSYTELIPLFNILAAVNQEGIPTKNLPPMVIIANEFSQEVVQFLLIQKTERGYQLCAIRGPNTTHVRTSYYDDLAVYTGGTRVGNGNKNITSITEDDIGYVKKVLVDKYKTTLYEGYSEEEDILKRVDQLKASKSVAESPYDLQIINDRIAALTNGIAKIGVGGVTELEIKEKYDRIEDALNAARAALQEGVVPGGGSTLLRISADLDASKSHGHKILKNALKYPFCQILYNIGFDDKKTALIAIEVLSQKKTVYDARNRKITSAMKAGIIDPAKVTKAALENAVSIASLLSTAGGAIIFHKKD